MRCNPEHSKQVPVEYAEMSEVINRRSDTNGQNTGEELALRKDSVAHNVRWWHTSITSQRQQKVLHTMQGVTQEKSFRAMVTRNLGI